MKKSVLSLGLLLWTIATSAQINHIALGLERNLPSKSVYGICEDAQGRIWIGTDNGVAFFQDGTFHRINDTRLPSLVERVFPARDSGVYIIGNNPGGIWRIHIHGNFIKLDKPGRRKYSGHLVAFSKNEQAVYFSDWRHLIRTTEHGADTICQINGSHIQSLSTGPNSLPYVNNLTGIIRATERTIDTFTHSSSSTSAFLKDNSLIAFSKDGICTITESGTEEIRPWDNDQEISPAHAISNGTKIWFTGVRSGLFQYDEGQVTCISEKLLMPTVQFTYVFIDSKGNVWCGTNGDGIVILPKYTYLNSYTDVNGLSDGFIRSVSHPPSGESYVVTKTGLHIISDGQVSNIPVSALNDAHIQLENVTNITTVKDQRIFSYGQRATAPGHPPKSYSYGLRVSGKSILNYRNQLVLGGISWFEVWGIDTETTSPSFHLIYSKDGHPHGNTSHITGVDSGYLFSADGGIFHYSHDKNEVFKLPTPKEPEGYFLAVCKSSDGQLWATSRHHVYSWNSSIWKNMFRFDSLQSGILTDLAIDAYDDIWIGTENGLINISEQRTTRVTTLNGLLDNNISALDYKAHDSSLWISTAHGLSVIDVKSQELGSRYDHNIHIKNIQVIDGKKYQIANEMALGNKENSFAISYGVDSHFDLGFPEYRYRLKETGGDWNYVHSTKAEFLALSPGNYTFEIEARVPGRLWSLTETVHISINLPLWKTWEFYTVVSIGLFLLTTLVYFIRLRTIRAQDHEKRTVLMKINHLELQALNANMNPHFIFNSLNSIQHYLLPLKNIQAINYVSNLSKLIRLNMNAIGKKLVHLQGELQRTELYIKLEQERFDKALDYEFELHLINSSEAIWLPSMIIQPVVENAIWHGIMPSAHPGKINVTIHEQDGFLHVQVHDNGVGLSHSKKNKKPGHESMGINLTLERLKLQDSENDFQIQEIFTDEGTVDGTRVDIKIKVALSN